jgi:hypothetical protein
MGILILEIVRYGTIHLMPTSKNLIGHLIARNYIFAAR